MDFEDAWREAMQEEAQTHHQYSTQPSHTAVASTTAADNDPYDEFSDDDLLQSVPFANDTAPPAPVATMLASPPPPQVLSAHLDFMGQPGNTAAHSSTRTLLTTSSISKSAPVTKKTASGSSTAPKGDNDQRGVLNFPPSKGSSFLLRGDDGRVRWVTASGPFFHEKNRATRARRTTITNDANSSNNRNDSTRRERKRGNTRKRSRQEPTVVEVCDDDEPSDDGVAEAAAAAVVVIDADSPASGRDTADHEIDSLSVASVDESNDNEDDDDNLPAVYSDASSAAAEDDADDELRGVPTFLRDGLHVKELLHNIYVDDAKQQAEKKEKEAEDARRRAAMMSTEREDELKADTAASPYDPFLTPTRPSRPPRATSRSASHGARDSGELWVTKYSPKLFREVLSDESINLRLLQWLKSWDAYVFPDDATAGSTAGQSRTAVGLKGEVKTPFQKDVATVSAAGDAKIAVAAPPAERIAVLTGPPGVGKTTLVHVLAAHCGYEVIEVNASVERTASRLEALIKTAVSAAGPAPGGRVRRPPPPSPSSVSATTAGPAATSTVHGSAGGEEGGFDDGGWDGKERAGPTTTTTTTSLVQHLLRPKCLVIDEMDGIASSSVAAYLMQLQLHRPVFCLCNDFYVPSLRPLRQRCSHVYYMPPIRPQRLLARLEEIARREHVTGLDQMALSELITVSGGDVRSCLNTMQFINSVINQQRDAARNTTGNHNSHNSVSSGSVDGSGGGAAPSQRHTVAELIRRMQGKDTRVALKESWQLLFTRPERNKAVQLLKQDCGVDYEAMVEAAVAQSHRQHIVETRRRQERERAIGRPAATSSDTLAAQRADAPASNGGVWGSPSLHPQPEVAKGFRMDPGYLYAAQQLLRCPDSAGLVDGLQENYLDRAYTDYTFLRTSATADSFSRQDVVVTAAFQHPELMGTAERLNQVSALTCYVHCSTAARGGRIEFPREQATLRRLQSESKHIGQQFRGGCRAQLSAFLGGEEVTCTDTAPMLLRCLFDRALRLPGHAITSFSRLPPADQKLMQASVARHVEYGLNYEKDRHYTPPSSFFGGASRLGPFGVSGAEDDVPWRLTPELDKLIAGVVRPMERALHGGGGGGGGRGYDSSSFFNRSRYGDRNGHHAGGGTGAAGAAAGMSTSPANGFSSYRSGGAGSAATAASARPSLASVLMPIKNEVRQILVGEIRQYQILQSMEFLKKQQGIAAEKGVDTANSSGKRPREEKLEESANVTTTTAEKSNSVAAADALAKAEAGEGADAKAVKVEVDSALPESKKVKREGDTGASPTGRTAVRRDFFGRPIPETATAANTARRGRTPNSTTPLSASPSPTGGGGGGGGGSSVFPRSQPPHVPSTQASVRYVYQDGSTNAVKMPAVFADF